MCIHQAIFYAAREEEALKSKKKVEGEDGELLKEKENNHPSSFEASKPEREMSSQANCNGIGETSSVRKMQSVNTVNEFFIFL